MGTHAIRTWPAVAVTFLALGFLSGGIFIPPINEGWTTWRAASCMGWKPEKPGTSHLTIRELPALDRRLADHPVRVVTVSRLGVCETRVEHASLTKVSIPSTNPVMVIDGPRGTSLIMAKVRESSRSRTYVGRMTFPDRASSFTPRYYDRQPIV